MSTFFTDIFPICLLLIILFDMYRNYSMNRKAKWFCFIVLLVLIVLLSDVAVLLLNGKIFPGASRLLLVANIVYFATSTTINYAWFLFVFHILYGYSVFHREKKYFVTFSLPLVCFILILIIKTSWIIQITENNTFQRGTYFFIQTVIGLSYMFLSCVRALVHGMREKVPSWRREDLVMASFVLYPFIGAVIQIVHRDFVLLWPATTLSLLLYYIFMRQDEIQKDELTGVYNRMSLDEYLSKCFYEAKPTDIWQLLILDLDRFKEINDSCGHAVGDKVLQKTARILRGVFRTRDAFVARYGGDEFAIVIKCSDDQVLEYKQKLQNATEKENATSEKDYVISMSIGSATYHYGKYKKLSNLIAEADDNMYLNKQECRREHNSFQ